MTITPVIYDYRENSSGKYPIKIRIHSPGTSKIYITVKGIKVAPHEWDKKKGEVLQGVTGSNYMNIIISDKLAEVKKKYLSSVADHRRVSSKNIADSVKSNDDFYYYFQKYINESFARESFARGNVDLSIMRTMKLWRSNLSVHELSHDTLSEFAHYLRTKETKKNTQNGITDKMGRIRSVVNKYLLGKIIHEDPFAEWKFKKTKSQPKGLTMEELQKMRNLFLQAGKQMWHARNMYLFAINAMGMRWGDVCRLRWENVAGGRISYRMGKNSKLKDMKASPEAKAILALYKKKGEYIFPVIGNLTTEQEIYSRVKNVGRNYNRSLHAIGRKIGFNGSVSFHTSRHTFGKMLLESGANIIEIMNAFSHGNVKTTQLYLETIDNRSSDKIIDSIFGSGA